MHGKALNLGPVRKADFLTVFAAWLLGCFVTSLMSAIFPSPEALSGVAVPTTRA